MPRYLDEVGLDHFYDLIDNNINNAINESKTFVTPQMYGAVGDGVTDDTTAFQAAINTGYDIYIPVDKGQIYKITGTLNITTVYQQIFSAYDSRITERNSAVGILFSPNSVDQICFNITAHGVRFIGLCIHGDTAHSRWGIGILADRSNASNQNVDFYCSNVELWNLSIGISHDSRGLRCDNVSFVNINTCIYKTQKLDATENQARALQIYNCRFHVIEDYCIRLSGNQTGTIISGCVHDLSSNHSLFIFNEGYLISSLITNCHTYSPMDLGTFMNSIVSNTTFRLPDTQKDYCIHINRTTGSQISNCSFRFNSENIVTLIDIEKNDSSTLCMLINDITFYTLSIAPTGVRRSVIRLSGTLNSYNRFIARNFTGIYESSSDGLVASIILADNSKTLTKSIVDGNASNCNLLHNVTVS